MPRYCEITHQKGEDLKKRKVSISEKEGHVRLHLTKHGVEKLKELGGLPNYLKDKDPKKLTPKLKALQAKLGLQPKAAAAEEKAAEPKQEAAAQEEVKSEKEAAPKEKASEEAKAEEKKD